MEMSMHLLSSCKKMFYYYNMKAYPLKLLLPKLFPIGIGGIHDLASLRGLHGASAAFLFFLFVFPSSTLGQTELPTQLKYAKPWSANKTSKQIFL